MTPRSTTCVDGKAGPEQGLHTTRGRGWNRHSGGTYPSIQVVLDVHRDGVGEDLCIWPLTEVDGRPTAQIMFFNGLKPDAGGPGIEYLANPYREGEPGLQPADAAGGRRRIFRAIHQENLPEGPALQPAPAGPGPALVEVGAQTNTYRGGVERHGAFGGASGYGA